VRALSRAGVRLIANDKVDRHVFVPRAGTRDELVTYVQADITASGIADLVAGVSGVIHAAAITPAEEQGEVLMDVLAINLVPFLHMLDAVRRTRTCEKLLFVSSASVYSVGTKEEVTEDDADGGDTLYGASKLACEIVGRRYAALAGFAYCAVRPTSLFGEGEEVRSSRPQVSGFARLIDAAAAGAAVRLTNPQALADWLSVDDASEAISQLWKTDFGSHMSFNLSSGRLRAFSEIAEGVSAVAPLLLTSDPTAAAVSGPDRPIRVSNERIRQAIGWRPAETIGTAARALVAAKRSRGS
jgi:UDP-glucose 4-epimerase